MTEHTKIPVPPKGGKRSSILERASGAFGLDGLQAAPIPGSIADIAMKRAKAREKGQPVPEFEPVPEQPEPVQTTQVTPPASARKAQAEEPVQDARPRVPQGYQPQSEDQPAERAETLPVPLITNTPEVIEHSARVALRGKRQAVNREHLRDQGLIDPDNAASALMEEFRIVKRQILQSARNFDSAYGRRILVCSPHTGDGKTFCASNLAIALAAERDIEVVLIDADFAKPSVTQTFGVADGPGFMDALASESANPERLVIETDIRGLWLMPAGRQTGNDSEYLTSRRTSDVLERLTQDAPNRILVFDSPPALAASPAAELAKHVGQSVLVARADKTGQNALEDAVQLLSSCPDIKLLLNAAQFSPSGRRFGSYYGYEE